MARMRGARLRSCAVIAGAALVLAGCGGSSDGDSAGPSGGGDASDFSVGFKNDGGESSGDLVEGGSFTFGEWVQPASLDPAKYYVSGAIGGMEFAAIYDPLLRYDPE